MHYMQYANQINGICIHTHIYAHTYACIYIYNILYVKWDHNLILPRGWLRGYFQNPEINIQEL